MTDTLKTSGRAVYFLAVDELEPVAEVTDTYYEEGGAFQPQVQIRDLDVSLNASYLDNKYAIIPVNVGGVCVSGLVRNLMLKLGVEPRSFRPITVESRCADLFQLVAPICYRLSPVDPCFADGKRYYRGVIDPKTCCVDEVSAMPIGCIEGREDYQDTVFSQECGDRLGQLLDGRLPLIRRPVFDEITCDALCGKAWSSVMEDRLANPVYIAAFTEQELLKVLRTAVRLSRGGCAKGVYDVLKSRATDFAVKKEALAIYKSGGAGA